MPEVPRDPRQLARDILSGKISIEDIARERQNRAAGGGGQQQQPTAAPQARTPQQIPIPKQQQPTSPPPQQRPVARQPAPVQRRPMPQQQKAKPLQQKPRPQQPASAPSIQMAQSAQTTAYDAPKAIQDAKVVTAVVNKPLDIRELTQNRTSIRQGLLMAEILGKPLALRETI